MANLLTESGEANHDHQPKSCLFSCALQAQSYVLLVEVSVAKVKASKCFTFSAELGEASFALFRVAAC